MPARRTPRRVACAPFTPGSEPSPAALLLDLEAAQAEAADAETRRRSWKKRTKQLRRVLAQT